MALNKPFAGALVPASRYCRDPRVTAVMVEVNRDLYLQHNGFSACAEFASVASMVKASCYEALEQAEAGPNT